MGERAKFGTQLTIRWKQNLDFQHTASHRDVKEAEKSRQFTLQIDFFWEWNYKVWVTKRHGLTNNIAWRFVHSKLGFIQTKPICTAKMAVKFNHFLSCRVEIAGILLRSDCQVFRFAWSLHKTFKKCKMFSLYVFPWL